MYNKYNRVELYCAFEHGRRARSAKFRVETFYLWLEAYVTVFRVRGQWPLPKRFETANVNTSILGRHFKT